MRREGEREAFERRMHEITEALERERLELERAVGEREQKEKEEHERKEKEKVDRLAAIEKAKEKERR